MLMEEWQDRYYSFNHAWNTTLQQRMASMRNGFGDEWFMAFGAPSHLLSCRAEQDLVDVDVLGLTDRETSCERCRAVASPSPLLAPVMTTTLPAMLLLVAQSSMRLG